MNSWQGIYLHIEESIKKIEEEIFNLINNSDILTDSKGWSSSVEGQKLLILTRISLNLKSIVEELRENQK